MNGKLAVDFSLVLASSVHDMKNSIGMLVASLENFIADQPELDRRQVEHFNTLHYEASRINAELVQLLTIYRMQHEHLPLRLDRHFVVDALEDQIARYHSLIEHRDIDLDFQCDDRLEWCFDADLIGSVVQNVLVNCSRYTRSKILLSAEVVAHQLVITVADDGQGYPPGMLSAPGHLVDLAQVSGGKTHLGLYFAERIAALHRSAQRHGHIRLSNGPPLGGGCFQMFLP